MKYSLITEERRTISVTGGMEVVFQLLTPGRMKLAIDHKITIRASGTQAMVDKFVEAINGVFAATIEELPEYLVHREPVIRDRAKIRMEELKRDE